jgi:hypothetical protein
MPNITGDQIRARLRTLTAVDISDADLATAAFIPAGDAWLDLQLAKAAKTFAAATGNDLAIMKAVEIDFVCIKVISGAPVRGSKAGVLIEIKPIPSKDKKILIDLLTDEIWEYFELLAVPKSPIYVSSAGGDDYHPDGEDLTNIDISDTMDDFSRFD